MIRKFFAILILLVVLMQGSASAQHHRELDSLIAMQENVHDTVLPRLYHDIARTAWRVNPLMGLQYALLSLDAARNQGNYVYVVNALFVLSVNERELGRHEDSFRHILEAYDEALRLGDEDLLLGLYSSVGNAYMRMDSLDKAEIFVRKALRKSDSAGNNLLLSRAYLNLGLIDQQRGNMGEGLRKIEKSYQIMRDSVPNNPLLILPVKEMAISYTNLGDFGKAKNVLFGFLSEDIRLPELVRGQIWQMLANIYYRMGMQDSAAAANNISIQCAMETGQMGMVAASYKLMDSIYLKMGNTRKAAESCRQLISLSDTLFNTALDNQLDKVRYSLDYLEKTHELDRAKHERMVGMVAIVIGLVLILLLALAIRHIAITNRSIVSINKALDESKEAITDRVRFTYSIQQSCLPKEQDFGTSFEDRFIIFEPCDIVSGDFYWRYSDSRYEILAVADCTGHGIPGAILTMLGESTLQDIAQQGIREADKILSLLRDRVIFMMSQNDRDHRTDGMDISLMVVDRNTNTLDFAGAYNSLVYIRDGELKTIAATRTPIGHYPKPKAFVSQRLDMEPGDIYYMFSDGFHSQVGGRQHRKYTRGRFLDLLLGVHTLPMAEQKEAIMREYTQWKGHYSQVDDITVVGLVF